MKKGYRIGPGASSLLLTIVVLALTTLGALSLASAMQDRRLEARSIEMTRGYYEAASAAQWVLSEMDAALAALPEAANETAYWRAASEIRSKRTELVWSEGTVSFALDALEGRMLQVTLALLPPGSEERFKLIRHELGIPSDEEFFLE